MNDEQQQPVIITVNLNIVEQNRKPAIEMRKIVNDSEVMKQLISAAYHDQPIIIQPNFVNKAIAINKLQEKGIIHREEGTYKYLF